MSSGLNPNAPVFVPTAVFNTAEIEDEMDECTIAIEKEALEKKELEDEMDAAYDEAYTMSANTTK